MFLDFMSHKVALMNGSWYNSIKTIVTSTEHEAPTSLKDKHLH